MMLINVRCVLTRAYYDKKQMEEVTMVAKARTTRLKPLPSSFNALVRMHPPMTIHDNLQHRNNVGLIDRLM